MRFKKGQKIVCVRIKSDDWYDEETPPLKKGEIYTFSGWRRQDPDGVFIGLCEHPMDCYLENRFEPLIEADISELKEILNKEPIEL